MCQRVPQASQLVSGKITDLTRAKIAFEGVCTASEPMVKSIGAKGQVLASRYTFQVTDVLKGDVPEEFSFTHLGASRSDAESLGLPYIPGMPVFKEGQSYVVFLTSESSLGFRGVLNLGSGKFNMVEGADGKMQVVNDYGNKALFTGLPSTAKVGKALSVGGVTPDRQAGPVDYESFKEMFRELEGRE